MTAANRDEFDANGCAPCWECGSMLPELDPGACSFWIQCRNCAACVNGETRAAAIGKWNAHARIARRAAEQKGAGG